MKWDGDRRARAGLCAAAPLAIPDLAQLVASCGAEAVWRTLLESSEQGAISGRARRVVVDDLISATSEAGARFIVPGDSEWPDHLADLSNIEPVGQMAGEPYGLWVDGAGDLAGWCADSVAIIGSRACTDYGAMVASDFAFELAQHGYTIISGGAYGIDSMAHKAALAAERQTIAVLAAGIDVVYPRGNIATLSQVRQRGLLVTETPPGIRPTKAGFLARNRIIAALGRGVLIVEAAARSGARNTGAWGNALGRLVLAVPGSIQSAFSQTPHRLIRDGEATLVASAADALSLLAPLGDAPVLPFGGEHRLLDGLNPAELAVRECLPARGTRSAGEIAMLTGLDLPVCLSALGKLDLLGLVAATDDGRWRLLRPSGAANNSSA